jgi:hypothetical protein
MIFHVMLLFYCFLINYCSPDQLAPQSPLRYIYTNQAAINCYVYHHIIHAPLFFNVKLWIHTFSHTFTSFTLILNNDIKILSFTKYAKDGRTDGRTDTDADARARAAPPPHTHARTRARARARAHTHTHTHTHEYTTVTYSSNISATCFSLKGHHQFEQQ